MLREEDDGCDSGCLDWPLCYKEIEDEEECREAAVAMNLIETWSMKNGPSKWSGRPSKCFATKMWGWISGAYHMLWYSDLKPNRVSNWAGPSKAICKVQLDWCNYRLR